MWRQLSPRQRSIGLITVAAVILLILPHIRFSAPKPALPGAEAAFIGAVAQARAAWLDAPNDLAKAGMRQARAASLCRILQGLTAQGWTGWVAAVEPSQLPDLNGKSTARVVLSLGPHITLSTPASPLFNLPGTMVEAGAPLYAIAATLPIGAQVRFSARFFPSSADCMTEESFTNNGSMTNPEFKIMLTSLAAG